MSLAYALAVSGVKSHFMMLHEDGNLYYPDLGLHIEPTGYTYSYSDFIHVPITYHIPLDFDLDQLTPEHCDLSEKRAFRAAIADSLDKTKEDLSSRFQPYKSAIIDGAREGNHASPMLRNRKIKKRAVGLIMGAAAAVAVVGLVGANTYEIARIRNSAMRLESKLNGIQLKQGELIDSVNIIQERLNNIGGVVIPAIQGEIKALTEGMDCRTEMQDIKIAVLHGLTSATSRISDIINSLLQHVIVPELLSPHIIEEEIMKRKDMENSLYQEDIQLVYQLSQGVLTSVRYDPFLIGAVMIVPKLMKEHIGMTLSITKVPVLDELNHNYHILATPDLVLRDLDKKKIWATDYTRCKSVAGIYFCSIQVLHRKTSSCLESLVFNNDASKCRKIRSEDDPTERVTLSGILVTNRHVIIKKITSDRDGNTKATDVSRTNEKSLFISRTNASEVLVGNRVYILNAKEIEVSDDVRQMTFKTPGLNISFIPMTWTDLSNITHTTQEIMPSVLITSDAILWPLIIGTMCLLYYVLRKLMRRIRALENYVQTDMGKA